MGSGWDAQNAKDMAGTGKGPMSTQRSSSLIFQAAKMADGHLDNDDIAKLPVSTITALDPASNVTDTINAGWDAMMCVTNPRSSDQFKCAEQLEDSWQSGGASPLVELASETGALATEGVTGSNAKTADRIVGQHGQSGEGGLFTAAGNMAADAIFDEQERGARTRVPREGPGSVMQQLLKDISDVVFSDEPRGGEVFEYTPALDKSPPVGNALGSDETMTDPEVDLKIAEAFLKDQPRASRDDIPLDRWKHAYDQAHPEGSSEKDLKKPDYDVGGEEECAF